MRNFLSRSALALIAIFAVTVTSDAHDFWIEPTLFQPDTGDRTEFNLRVGQDLTGDTLPWVPEWFIDYRVTGPAGPKPVKGLIGDIPAGGFTPDSDALYLVSYFSSSELANLDAEKFNHYLEAEGLTNAIEARRAAGKENERGLEYYSRCAKSLIKAGDGSDTSVLSTVLGYPLEIIPLNNPYALDANKKLKIRVLYNSAPISGLTVFAFNAADPGDRQRIITDDSGEANFVVKTNGTWLIKAVHIFAIEDRPADWESFWASLTFRL